MTLAGLANRAVLSWGWKRRGIAFASGAISALAMAPFHLWPVLAVTFPVLVWLLDGAGAGRRGLAAAFGAGWWFGFGYFVAGLYWIGMALFVEADKFAWLLPFAVLGIPAGLAFFTGFGALIARAMWTTGPLRILAFAAALGISEWLRGTILTGFPWNSFGYALTGMLPFAQGASLVGLWGLTLLSLAIFASPATIADARDRTQHPWLPLILSALALLLLGALLGRGRGRHGALQRAVAVELPLLARQALGDGPVGGDAPALVVHAGVDAAARLLGLRLGGARHGGAQRPGRRGSPGGARQPTGDEPGAPHAACTP